MNYWKLIKPIYHNLIFKGEFKMNNKFMQKFIEIAGRIGAQRQLVAIRDGVVAVMPLVMIGSVGILVNNFPPLGKFEFVEWMNGIYGVGHTQRSVEHTQNYRIVA